MAKLEMKERGKRKALAGRFVQLALKHPGVSSMGPTLQALVIETVRYKFLNLEVEYTKKEGKLNFETEVDIAGVVIRVKDSIPEEKFNMGVL